jgi:hypothetical protein
MSKGDTFENDLALLLFNGVPITGLADVGVADPITTLYVALHIAVITDAETQEISESAYVGYARVAVARTSAGWTVAGGIAQNAVDVIFPVVGSEDFEVIYASIGQEPSGPGKIFHYGPLVEAMHIHVGFIPTIQAGKLRAGEE